MTLIALPTILWYPTIPAFNVEDTQGELRGNTIDADGEYYGVAFQIPRTDDGKAINKIGWRTMVVTTPFDTREKRACILGVGRPWMRDKLPGTIDEGWRLATGNVYCGNALTPPVGGFQAAWAVNANTLLGGGIT